MYDFELIRDMYVLLYGCVIRKFSYRKSKCFRGHCMDEKISKNKIKCNKCFVNKIEEKNFI